MQERSAHPADMFARLCHHHLPAEGKRRHSWSSDSDFQLQEGLLSREPPPTLSTWYLHPLDGVSSTDVPDLVGPCRHVQDAHLRRAEEEQEEEQQLSDEEMGQRPSRPKLSLTWVLRGDRQPSPPAVIPASHPSRTLSEPSLLLASEAVTTTTTNTATTTPRSCRTGRERHRHRRTRPARHKSDKQRKHSRFGYEIQDVDAFLTKASLEKPANIPVVLSSACVLYQTRAGGYQEEVALPLGMVVNAVFKNHAWLYVQTPHGEEGYVTYGACLPLGILPPPQRARSASKPPPCWETHTDIFPQPLGNRTDTEKLRDGTRSECGGGSGRRGRGPGRGRYAPDRDAVSTCGERSVDRLYLRATAGASSRHTLLVIRSDYSSRGRNTLSVAKGDVVALLSGHLKDWFWVRRRDGCEGFIPSVVAGHGFL